MTAFGSPHVLREYALLADGYRGALVGPRGDISWMCAPRWHDDAVFSELIGGAGAFTIQPTSRFVWGGHYERAGLIWRSRWVTDDGITECREALAYPGDPHRLILLRRLQAVQGPARARVSVVPAAEFGRAGMQRIRRDDAGTWRARIGALHMRVTGLPDARDPGSSGGPADLTAEVELAEGDQHDIVLEISDRALPDEPVDIDLTWHVTEHHWGQAVPRMDSGIAVGDTRQSYAVLRGMTAPGGGMVAAATLGLPERARAGRNYDYRYVWIRDQCYAGLAVAVDEPLSLLDDAVAFVGARLLSDGPDLRPAYAVDGGAIPAETTLDLPGYPGGNAVVGNRAGTQFQLDAFGEALQLFAAAARLDHLDSTGYRAMRTAAQAVAQQWRGQDAGIWELDERRWAQSRLACVGGLRAAAAQASRNDAAEWSALADAILADTADCCHPSGRWQRAPDDDRVDAALLLPALRGAVPADDPRSRLTVTAVADELARDFYVYRFRHDARPLHEAEGAFALCGFLMALATHQQGDQISAVRYFERNRAACGPPGLLSEEYDVLQRQMRGNLPQAFVHALLIESALVLARPPSDSATQPPGDAPGRPGNHESDRRRKGELMTTRSFRSIEFVRGAWGAVLLAAPVQVLDSVAGNPDPDRWAVNVARILGARHLTQAVLSGRRPTSEVLAAGVWVDAVHSATALVLAGVDRRRARLGVTDAAVAAAWGAAGWHDLAGRPRTGPQHQRLRDRLAAALLPHLPGGQRLLRRARRT